MSLTFPARASVVLYLSVMMGLVLCLCSSHRCQLCAEGLFFDKGSCKECPDLAITMVVTCCVLCVGFALVFGATQFGDKICGRAMESTKTAFQRVGIIPKTKITVAFLQIWTSIPSVYAVRVPYEMLGWFDAFHWLMIDWDDVYSTQVKNSSSHRVV